MSHMFFLSIFVPSNFRGFDADGRLPGQIAVVVHFWPKHEREAARSPLLCPSVGPAQAASSPASWLRPDAKPRRFGI